MAQPLRKSAHEQPIEESHEVALKDAHATKYARPLDQSTKVVQWLQLGFFSSLFGFSAGVALSALLLAGMIDMQTAVVRSTLKTLAAGLKGLGL